MQYTFSAPINNDPEDNESLTTKSVVSFLNCRSFFPDPSPENGDNSQFWNCNICPNDDKYCQPYIIGDKIYMQLPYQPFVIPETGGNAVGPYFNVIVDNEPIEVTSGITTQIGIGISNSINYINVVIDTSDPFFSDKPCWFFQIALQNANLAIDGSGNPIGPEMLPCFTAEYAANGGNYQAAIDHCAYLYLTDKYNTEFYCEVRCEEQTILVEGNYNQDNNGRRPFARLELTDCSGKFHGLLEVNGLNALNLFQHSYRVRGIVESSGFEFEETKIKEKRVKSKQREVFILFTNKIPYYVAIGIAACFNSKETTIDTIVYFGTIKLTKNFEEGNMWIIKENIFIECDEINFSCN